MATQVGKRYVCTKCGAEYIATRAGKGTLYCCGQAMKLKESGEKQSQEKEKK